MCMCNKEYVKEVLFVYVNKEVRITLYYSWYQNLCQEGYGIALFFWNHEEAFYSILHIFKEIKSMR
jgi:hypothetical protein